MTSKILFVDDDRLVVKSIERLLKKAGYQVCAVRSGQEALKKVSEEDFDLIVCDVRMPGMDGIETVERMRDHWRQNAKPHPPEILISGYDSKENVERAQALRVAAYIYKPFDLAKFLSAVRLALFPSCPAAGKPVLKPALFDEREPVERAFFWL